MSSNAKKSVTEMISMALLIAIGSLLLGTVLDNSVFTSISIINVTYLTEQYGSAINTLVGFFGLVMVAAAVFWAYKKFAPLFAKKGGLGDMSA